MTSKFSKSDGAILNEAKAKEPAKEKIMEPAKENTMKPAKEKIIEPVKEKTAMEKAMEQAKEQAKVVKETAVKKPAAPATPATPKKTVDGAKKTTGKTGGVTEEWKTRLDR